MDSLRFTVWFAILIAGAILCAVLGVFWTVPANAQESPCVKWADMQRVLKESFDETPTGGVGMMGKGLMISLLASPGGEKWTLVTIDVHDVSCVIASGIMWMPEIIEPMPVPGKRAS